MAIELEHARQAVERLMEDECRFDTLAGEGELDRDDFSISPTAPTLLFESECKVRPVSDAERGTVMEGGEEVPQRAYIIAIPLSKDPVPKDTIATILSSKRDSELEGKEFKILGSIYSTMAVQRKLVGILRPW